MNLRFLLAVVFFWVGTFLWAQTETPQAEPVQLTYHLKSHRGPFDSTKIAIHIRITNKDGQDVLVREALSCTLFDESGKRLADGKFRFG